MKLKPVLLFVFIVLTVFNLLHIDSASHSVSDTLINFVPQTAVLALLFFFIARQHSNI